MTLKGLGSDMSFRSAALSAGEARTASDAEGLVTVTVVIPEARAERIKRLCRRLVEAHKRARG